MKISIIVPVYNPPLDRLEACIASVMGQTFSDWELVIVDDGSDDAATIEYLSKLSSADSRVRVHTQPNGGPGRARNLGTDLAQGDYITYLDADDQLPDYTLADAVETVADSGAQVVLGFLQRIRGDAEKLTRQSQERKVLEGADVAALFDFTLAGVDRLGVARRENTVIKNGPIARFVETTVAREVSFPEDIAVSEDTIWNLRLFRTVTSACVTDSVWYWYWVAHDSTSRGYRSDALDQVRGFFRILEDELGDDLTEDQRTLAFMRVVNEVDRVARTYYSMAEAEISLTARFTGGRSLLKSTHLSRRVPPRMVLRTGPTVIAKYVLCWTGLAPAFWYLRRRIQK